MSEPTDKIEPSPRGRLRVVYGADPEEEPKVYCPQGNRLRGGLVTLSHQCTDAGGAIKTVFVAFKAEPAQIPAPATEPEAPFKRGQSVRLKADDYYGQKWTVDHVEQEAGVWMVLCVRTIRETHAFQRESFSADALAEA